VVLFGAVAFSARDTICRVTPVYAAGWRRGRFLLELLLMNGVGDSECSVFLVNP